MLNHKLKTKPFYSRFWNDSPKIQGHLLFCFDNGLLHWIFFFGSHNVFLSWLALVWKSDKRNWNFLYTLYLVSLDYFYCKDFIEIFLSK